MNSSGGLAPVAERRLGAVLAPLCRWLAIVGGVALLAIIALTVTSVGGRALVALGLRPVPGDFELIEFGAALAVFCFLPWCQIERGHVTVDVLASVLGDRLDAWLEVIANLLMTAAAAFIAVRLYYGLLDKLSYGETSFILQLPLWWAYSACLPAATLFALVSAYTVWRSVNEARTAAKAHLTRPTL